MWPFCFVLNKILKAEEDEEEIVNLSDGNIVSKVERCSSEHFSSNEKYSDALLPRAHFVEVPHVNQLFSWDCGLACVLMVLRTIGINKYDIQGLAELCCTTSIWTVDLAYLLQKLNIKFSYFTVTFGVNPNYSVETFYKEQLPTDLVRVDMLFQKARGAGINIECRSISRVEISLKILSGNYVAIALVDQYKLSQPWMEEVIVPGLYNNCGYTGHYVVICGYDAGADEFEIRDPASSRKHEKVSSKRLEEARKSFGTDEDLLLISLEKNEK
ncbi:guanylyl cyclase 1 isoform X1 [Mangifera indica]|uniref:guanylyl cyclase 1 isoform X1 n=2 Tax=Mangifera indica TaxID=29780 RepID=UPI001CFC21DF|nr:guanylyl cyclase 1 isoform X1 [Mangifera indica]XP_044462304.1 guanylyl cyclase 1 isoform X1 [Mangifera indica]